MILSAPGYNASGRELCQLCLDPYRPEDLRDGICETCRREWDDTHAGETCTEASCGNCGRCS